MKIVRGRPPIYEEIVRVVGRPPAGAVFTWGDTLFVPTPPQGMMQPLARHLLEHEETHRRQQAMLGGPSRWWRRYLDDVAFRRQQEIVAYRNQYAFERDRVSRQVRRALLRKLASDLSGPMYGRCISREDAQAAILDMQDVETVVQLSQAKR